MARPATKGGTGDDHFQRPGPPDNEPTNTDLSDAAVDAALAAGDAQLLDYVRTHADPAAALNALLDDMRVDALAYPARPSFGDVGTSSSSAAKAANRIFVRTLANDLDLDLVRVRAIARARALARDLARDRGLARYLAHDRGLARGLAFDLAHALEYARDLDYVLKTLPVDASGADLTGVRVPHLAVLDGVVWDERTRWPSDLRGQITDRSEEIASGVYQVRGGYRTGTRT